MVFRTPAIQNVQVLVAVRARDTSQQVQAFAVILSCVFPGQAWWKEKTLLQAVSWHLHVHCATHTKSIFKTLKYNLSPRRVLCTEAFCWVGFFSCHLPKFNERILFLSTFPSPPLQSLQENANPQSTKQWTATLYFAHKKTNWLNCSRTVSVQWSRRKWGQEASFPFPPNRATLTFMTCNARSQQRDQAVRMNEYLDPQGPIGLIPEVWL